MPTALRRSCTHLGEGPFFTLRISRPAKMGQAFLFSGVKSSEMRLGLANFPATGSIFLVRKVPNSAATRSRATPNTLAASPRLGVIETSITGSVRPNAAAAGAPTWLSWANSMMPSWSSPKSSSRAEHIIPRDSTPRMLPTLSASPEAGITVPGLASTTLIPARALGAPHTICSGSLSPLLTMQRRKRSALGCFSALMISATVKSFSRAPASSMLSTSRPMLVSLSAIAWTSALVSR